MKDVQRANSDERGVIENLTETLFRKEKEVRELMSLENPNPYQEAKIRKLLTEMGEDGNHLKTISGKKEVDFFKYC